MITLQMTSTMAAATDTPRMSLKLEGRSLEDVLVSARLGGECVDDGVLEILPHVAAV